MSIEWRWVLATTGSMALLFWRFVPLARIREAAASYLTMLVIKWFIGALKVQLHLVTSTFRFFPHATRQDFFVDFLIYPCACVLYVLHYPSDRRSRQILYTVAYATALALWNEGARRYTRIQDYIHWSSMYYFLILCILLPACSAFVTWLFAERMREELRNVG